MAELSVFNERQLWALFRSSESLFAHNARVTPSDLVAEFGVIEELAARDLAELVHHGLLVAFLDEDGGRCYRLASDKPMDPVCRVLWMILQLPSEQLPMLTMILQQRAETV